MPAFLITSALPTCNHLHIELCVTYTTALFSTSPALAVQAIPEVRASVDEGEMAYHDSGFVRTMELPTTTLESDLGVAESLLHPISNLLLRITSISAHFQERIVEFSTSQVEARRSKRVNSDISSILLSNAQEKN
ncbi:hypothetical protein BD779DRAFT_1673931 [Infundibulicybe gibba]|nr:hypothetical protein BD779DRAFT_1673931 [Infundibulicybe gibba]